MDWDEAGTGRQGRGSPYWSSQKLSCRQCIGYTDRLQIDGDTRQPQGLLISTCLLEAFAFVYPREQFNNKTCESSLRRWSLRRTEVRWYSAFGNPDGVNLCRRRQTSIWLTASLYTGWSGLLGLNLTTTCQLQTMSNWVMAVQHEEKYSRIAPIASHCQPMSAKLTDIQNIKQSIVQPAPVRKTLKRAHSVYQDTYPLFQVEPEFKIQKSDSSKQSSASWRLCFALAGSEE